MKLLSFKLIATLLLILLTNASASDKRLHCEVPVFDELKTVITSGSNTTSLRREQKFSITKDEAENNIQKLKTMFGNDFSLRDKVILGRSNVTLTDYYKTFYIKNGTTDRRIRIRWRQYGDRAEGTKAAVQLSKGYEEYGKFELKVDDEKLEGVVVKPSIYMKASDKDLLIQSYESFKANRLAIRERTLQALENGKAVNTPEVLDAFLNSLDELHRTILREKGKDLGLEYSHNVQYERSAYQVSVYDHTKNPPKKVDLQFTVDRQIEFRKNATSTNTVSEIPDSYRVFEFKVPTEYAYLSDEELAQKLPELLKVKKEVIYPMKVVLPEGEGKAALSKQYKSK